MRCSFRFPTIFYVFKYLQKFKINQDLNFTFDMKTASQRFIQRLRSVFALQLTSKI